MVKKVSRTVLFPHSARPRTQCVRYDVLIRSPRCLRLTLDASRDDYNGIIIDTSNGYDGYAVRITRDYHVLTRVNIRCSSASERVPLVPLARPKMHA